MIPTIDFTISLQNGSIKPSQSIKQAKQILKQQSIDYLANLRLTRSESDVYKQNYFETEDAITFTHLYRTQDSYGRPCEVNHTVIMKVWDYITAYPPSLSLVNHVFTQDKVITQDV